MGSYIGQLSEDAVRAAVGAPDDDALLHTVFVTEERSRLDMLARVLDEQTPTAHRVGRGGGRLAGAA